MFRYMSIDPGTNSLGIAINGIDLQTGEKKVLHSTTTNIDRLVEWMYGETVIPIHGLRYAKVLCCQEVIFKFLVSWNIQAVVSESPYMGRFPQAFSALVECMQAMRMAAYRYNPNMPFNVIDPSTVKMVLGVKGNSGDKSLMTSAVTRVVGDHHDVQYLDEHAIDAIAVGHAFFVMQLQKQLG